MNFEINVLYIYCLCNRVCLKSLYVLGIDHKSIIMEKMLTILSGKALILNSLLVVFIGDHTFSIIKSLMQLNWLIVEMQ
jgi:hypothetical protein